MTLTRWNPRREMMRLRNEFDRFFDDTLDYPRWAGIESFAGPALDVSENDDAYIVKASLPGIKPEDLDISITDNILTIKGETKEEETISEGKYHLRERRFGAFSRTVALPTTVDAESVDATYEDGILTLTALKTEDVKRKRITVKSVDSTKMLEGEVAEE